MLPILLAFLFQTVLGVNPTVEWQDDGDALWIYEFTNLYDNAGTQAGTTYLTMRQGGNNANNRIYKQLTSSPVAVRDIAYLEPHTSYVGHHFDGEEIECQRLNGNNGAASANDWGEEFGLVMWVHIYDLGNTALTGLNTEDQTIFCKQSPDFSVGVTNPSRETLCLHFNHEKFYWTVGDDVGQVQPTQLPRNEDYLSNLLEDDDEEFQISGQGDYVDHVSMDMKPVIGWSMLAFNVRVETNYTAFEGYRMSADYSSYNHTGIMYRSIYHFLDDGLSSSDILCFGARLTYDGTEAYGDKCMNGIIQQVSVFENNMGRGMINDQGTYKCQPWCAICKVKDGPTCFAQYHESILVYWDFAPPHYYFPINNVRPDISVKNGNFMPADHPLDPFGHDFIFGDPIYVDRQGALFDTEVKTMASTAPTDLHVHSFSVEIWLAWHMDWELAVHGEQVAGNTANQMVLEKVGGTTAFDIRFDVSNLGVSDQMIVNLGGADLTMDLDVGSTTQVFDRKWYFVAATFKKMNSYQTEICGYFGDYIYECETVNEYFDDVHTSNTNSNYGMNTNFIVGGGFIGIIRKIKIHAWAKLYMDMRFSWREGDDCLSFPGQQEYDVALCDQCDIESPMVTHDRYDWNFKYECYSTCDETTFEWDCRPCHEECRTCFGASEYHCHSCNEYSWDDELYFHPRGTRCTDECGNGITLEDIGGDTDADGNVLDYHECDDGDIFGGNGCSANCAPEMIYTCTGGSPTTADACVETCPDSRRLNEQCDDGNTNDGDGCSSTCTIEAGFECQGFEKVFYGDSYFYNDVCYEDCGDGRNYGWFECDDSDNISGDGCSLACVEELGYNCSGGGTASPDVCTEICGDGL
jgi:cysteine-rich repeat protein